MKNRPLAIALACIVAIDLRFLELPMFNFGAMAALAFFCGSVVRDRWALLIPLAVRCGTDVIIHVKTGYGFWASWPFDYVAYAVIFMLIGRNVNPTKKLAIFGGSIACVVTYFLLSNFGVWAMNADMYPRTIAGLTECYVAAVPFARGTLIGNLIFAPLFFVAWNMLVHSQQARAATATN